MRPEGPRRDFPELARQRLASRLAAPLLWLLVAAAARLLLGCRLPPDNGRRRALLWEKLDAHRGPLILAANHLTLVDSFLVYWALTPLRRCLKESRMPWSTPERDNFYSLGPPWRAALLRGLLYLCRCIPFRRGGEDAEAERAREEAFDKCAWVLDRGGAVFVFPEAGRSRSGWFEPRRPKDFLGRLALRQPRAKLLCVYLRGDRQIGAAPAPPRGELLRWEAVLEDGARDGETPREVSRRLFSRLGELQEAWWKGSPLPKNCGGNDVLDLEAPLLRENFSEDLSEADPEWLARHLTPREEAYLAGRPAAERFAAFWRLFCAKEAAHKALARAGAVAPPPAFRQIEVDLFLRRAEHRPTGLRLDLRFTDDAPGALHAIAVLRGGFIGDEEVEGDVLWRVARVPPGEEPGAFARGLALDFIASCSDEIAGPGELALSEAGGLPSVLWRGRAQDWSLSLSHSGRFAACSFMAS